ncbi:anaphase-promoting complex, cyclosome, subunit 4-domain-containing protein [Sphaerosporella brunnea]|uniref:Anaphase-promoting complex subunit 4 n=1 Tax=Sphaerosporella brunnea TaxID=1250544 RepID=A0A5J5EQQ0_9PEZI|nr:anaphase-promoting complex, cyclosome, subunit 4-domain-containing protein [Sphaerosporella brunnea]
MAEDASDGTRRRPAGFRILYQKTLPFAACRGIGAWSPQLDLIAHVTQNDNVLLYRMNGQRVWGIAHKTGDDIKVQTLQWRPDGKMLALGYSDGTTRIYDVNNGKAIHRIVSEVDDSGSVTCLGWVDNHSHTITLGVPPEAKTVECTPQTLFDLDIGSMLPRLSTLPATAGPESTFTSKTTLEALVNSVSKGGEGSHLDVLLIGQEGGKVLLNIFESFLIGTMDLSSLCHQLKPRSTLLRHTASQDLSTHALLIAEPETGRLLFATMDILFVQQFGQYLFQLASTSTRVQALIRYMRETVTSIETEFKTFNDLSQKYVNIINEEAQKVGSDVGLEMFEFLVTGGPSSILKEWLADVLTERGQKRWEKSSTTGYETIRRVVHENLLPTCERLIVLFSRLRGLARWKESGSPLGLEPEDFTRCLEVVASITLYAHEFISAINHEFDLFKSFMMWLRYSLDQLATVINIDEKPTEDPQIDHLKVADYVGEFLKESSLKPFMKRNTKPKLSDHKERGESILDLYSKTERSATAPGFMELAEYLDELSKTVFSKPQQAMRQQLRVSKPVLLRESGVDKIDTRIVDSKSYTCLYPGKDNGGLVLIIRCEISINGGLSSISKIGCAKMEVPRNYDVADMKFVDDNLIILLLVQQDTKASEMLTVDFSALDYDEGFNPSRTSRSVYSYARSLPYQKMKPVMHRTFESNFLAAQVMVNGKEGRRVGSVLANDDMSYFVFDLDHTEDDEEEEEEEEEEEGMVVDE